MNNMFKHLPNIAKRFLVLSAAQRADEEENKWDGMDLT